MSIAANIEYFNQILTGTGCRLVAVSKTKSPGAIMEAYQAGFKRFGENRVQELKEKHQSLPEDIEWHMIGHLQTKKVKMIAPFVSMIHAVDSIKLASEIDKHAERNGRTIHCLLQVHIAKESSKFGFDGEELLEAVKLGQFDHLEHLKICGLMGMATFTSDQQLIRSEFKTLKTLFETIRLMPTSDNFEFREISMGMSNDYQIAIEEGSTMIRIGSDIFGARD
ncbi:MAG: YggS family pyridoxal phosphate enzyme [Cyclobacteriaceae bacterium]|nr:MAG: YggS family pyridoxal phosphate enzyme [Cyclobacteriaceae bacterium]